MSRRWLSASPGGLWVFEPERSAPHSQVPSRGQTGLGHYLLMPVCKRLLFTSWLRIFEASKLRGCLFFFFFKGTYKVASSKYQKRFVCIFFLFNLA